MPKSNIQTRFKPAIILREPQRVEEVYKALISSFEKDPYRKGIHLVKALHNLCSKAETEAIVLNLADRGLLRIDSSKYGFEFYEISNLLVDDLKKDLLTQKEASELISLVNAPDISSELSSGCTVVATLPTKDPNFKFKGELDFIYPNVQRMLSEAKFSIFIVNPFFDEEGANKILSTLIAAAKVGISIQLIVREATESSNMRSSLSIIRKRFKEEGFEKNIQIREYFKRNKSGQIYATHAKVVLVDNVECYIGSANITFPGMYYNFELGCILKGEHVSKVKRLLEMLWECSGKV